VTWVELAVIGVACIALGALWFAVEKVLLFLAHRK
jgi:hypothetical protein